MTKELSIDDICEPYIVLQKAFLYQAENLSQNESNKDRFEELKNMYNLISIHMFNRVCNNQLGENSIFSIKNLTNQLKLSTLPEIKKSLEEAENKFKQQ